MTRRTQFFLTAAVAVLASCDTAREVTEYSIQDFLATTGYSGGSFSPDNSKLLVGSNETGIYNAYAISVADGSKEALTTSTTDAVRPLGYFPNDERFLYLADEGGNELMHLVRFR